MGSKFIAPLAKALGYPTELMALEFPVYGFGVISVFAMINMLQNGGHPMNDGMLFLFGIILATAVELIAGWLLDVCFHARWWDYSDKPLNFH